MVSISSEILLHDKMRFSITVVSLMFAIVMVIYDMGMFFGVTGDSVTMVDRAQANWWIAKEGEGRLNGASQVPKIALRRARRIPGVAQACPLDYLPGNLKNGDTLQVIMIGIDPACPLFQPWELAAGSLAGIRQKDTLIIDEMALKGKPSAKIGDVVKINDHELRLVALTRNNKSFSYPFVYMSLQTFEKVTGLADQYNYIALQTTPAADRSQLAAILTPESSELALVPSQEFRAGTISALIAQGVSMIFVVVLIGVLVGMLIITMTMYTATMERLREFAILKALGATRWKIWGIVLEQALLETGVGFAIGLAASFGVNALVEGLSGIRARFPVEMIAACFGLMLLLAVLGSLLSIRKATRVDPVMVFRA